jgi:hypothetical protein
MKKINVKVLISCLLILGSMTYSQENGLKGTEFSPADLPGSLFTKSKTDKIDWTKRERFEAIAGLAGSSPQASRENLNFKGMPAVIILPSFITKADLSDFNLGTGRYVPIDLRSRKSVYELNSNESVVTGMYVTYKGVFFRRFTRLNGTAAATNGDLFRVELVNESNKTISIGQGPLVIDDLKIGKGHIAIENNPALAAKSIWILWSCIDVEK